MNCDSCKTSNPSNAKFCRQCGAHMGGADAAPDKARTTHTATKIFTWIGYGVVGLFVLGLLSNF